MRILQELFAPYEPSHEIGQAAFRAAFRAMPVLETARLLVRPPNLRDAEDFYTFARDEEMCRYVLWDAHKNPRESRETLRGMIKRNHQGYPGTFVIEIKNERRMIGTIGFQWIDPENNNCELGYSIARRLWGHGIAAEALEVVVRYAFDQLDLNRVEAKHDVLNPASGRVLDKAGFLREGLARESLVIKGRHADMQRYALLRAQWAKRQAEKPSP
jgi:ribosomal-protein-alanine N-acetyltransferase